MACGLNWSEPVSHFENVDFQGNVHIVRKLGEVEKLPIYLIFNSSYGTSPYAGSGFEIPFLESRMWQMDENRFQMKSPDGWLWIFQRTKTPNVLEGNAGWKGLIKDNSITVWAPCGDKISFKNGKIVSMQVKDDKFDYAYNGNRVESIQKNGRAILGVKSDEKTGEVSEINLPNTREGISLQQTESRPRVELDGGRKVVGRIEKCLAKLTRADGGNETFDFAVDSQGNPILKSTDLTITWDAETRKVINEGKWVYSIKSMNETFASAAIGRRDSDGKSEFWHYDGDKGQETITELDGNTTTRTWFLSGELSQKTRSIETRKNAILLKRWNYTYNEIGNLIRENRGNIVITYASNRRIVESIYLNGNQIYPNLNHNYYEASNN